MSREGLHYPELRYCQRLFYLDPSFISSPRLRLSIIINAATRLLVCHILSAAWLSWKCEFSLR
jgi:hypothetical protein